MVNTINDSDSFFSAFIKRFQLRLPGEAAHERMTARARISTTEHLKKNPDHRNSAVMLNLYPVKDVIHALLIRRNEYEGTHSGQLALPGGKMEPEDPSLLHTAIRETEEEVGVRLRTECIAGSLSPVYIPVSNFLVQPFVAFHDVRPDWVADPAEVAGLIEFDLRQLFDPQLKSRERIRIGKNMFLDAPCYLINGQVLWGATAMIFSELEVMINGSMIRES